MDQNRPPVLPYADTAALGPSAATNDTADGDEPDMPDRLPEHEQDDERTLGGGVMGAGGTAIDRGTGTLGGEAQGPGADDDEGDLIDRRVDEEPIDGRPDLGPDAGRGTVAQTGRTDDETDPLTGDPDENEPDDTVPSPQFRV
jgi:hypothetical protein